MPIAFQSNAFQSTYPGNAAFQGFARALYISKAGLVPSYAPVPRIRRGGNITFTATIVDPLVRPYIKIPASSVTLTLIDSEDNIVVNAAEMEAQSTGVYVYLHQTDISDVLGSYRLYIQATDGQYQDITANAVAFTLINS